MKARLALLLAFASVFSTPSAAQTPGAYSAEVRRALEAIEPAALEAHMRYLADDLLEGRGTGTRGYDLAARYVAAQFARLGLEPAGDSLTWYQSVPLRRARLDRSRSGLDLIRASGKQALVMDRDFLMNADTYHAATDVTAEVVFVGFGVTAPELGYDDFAGVDVRGKIAAVLTGAPPSFPATLRAHYSNNREKDANLAAHGAIGVLSIRTPRDERRATWERLLRSVKEPPMRWLDERGVPDGVAPELRGQATLHTAVAESLFARAGRPLAQVFADADSGRVRGFPLPLKARIRRSSLHQAVPSPNVVGLLRGSDPRLAAEVVVVSAHLDHLGIGVPVEGDSIYNGAFDNATGVAAMIEIAAAMARARPRRSVLFLAVTGEEKSLQGSSYFACHPTVPIERIVADVNLDMYVMVGPLREIIAYGAEHSTLKTAVNMAAGRTGLRVIPDPMPDEVIFVRSDQYSFVRQGVPSVFGVGASGEDHRAARTQWLRTNYHSPQDDLKQPLDTGSLALFTRFHYVLVHLVAGQSARPRWNEGDFFGERYGRRPAEAEPRP